jgi:hypothetical protein
MLPPSHAILMTKPPLAGSMTSTSTIGMVVNFVPLTAKKPLASALAEVDDIY